MPEPMTLKDRRVWVAGHRGMVGAALVRRLASEGCEVMVADRAECDLCDQAQTRAWVATNRPDVVFLAAAKVGGILANASRPVDFLVDNLRIETNVITAAYASGVRKLVFLGSSCIYPRDAAQPIVEDALLTGPLEPTNEWYAVAKIVGIKLCQAYRRQHGADFIAAMPTNLYGPGDTFDPTQGHVIPALIRKAHEAKLSGAPVLDVWGTGRPRREFLHVDDCADALVFLAQHYSDERPVNVGYGSDLEIAALARLIAGVVGYTGAIRFDETKPDGTPRKLLDSRWMHEAGWRPEIDLEEGLRGVYAWYRSSLDMAPGRDVGP